MPGRVVGLCLVVLCLAMTEAPGATAPSFVRADLFFMSWETRTRARQTPADVRRHPQVAVTTDDPECLDALLAALRLDALVKARRGAGPGDARLVVDLRDEHGALVTYYADWFELMSEDGLLRRPIDETFRDAVGRRLFLGREAWCAILMRGAT